MISAEIDSFFARLLDRNGKAILELEKYLVCRTNKNAGFSVITGLAYVAFTELCIIKRKNFRKSSAIDFSKCSFEALAVEKAPPNHVNLNSTKMLRDFR